MMSRPTFRCAALAMTLSLGWAGTEPARAAPPLTSAELSLPDIIAPLLGAVVNVSVLDSPDAPATGPQASATKNRPRHSLGSGFIIDPDGYIVTNRHVVAGGISVTVTLSDDRQLPARVLATNRYPDLALLKVDAGGKLPTVRFGDSSALRLGETVFAIGNPLGLSGSISVGVVSALNRDLKSTRIDDFIQTDAAINHGNSGGPLFNLHGEVVGVNWAIIAPEDSTGSVGLGLAIPANDAAFVVDQMRRFGRFSAGFPGMALQGVTPALATALGLSGTQGGIVTEVWPGGPADKAGIQVGDVVLQIGPEQTRDVRAMLRQLANFPPGSVGKVVLWRAGRTMSVDMVFASFPPLYDPAGPPPPAPRPPHPSSPSLGLRLASLSDDARKTYSLSGNTHGVLVEDVSSDSAGADARLARGDVHRARAGYPGHVPGRGDGRPCEGTGGRARDGADPGARRDGHGVAGDRAGRSLGVA